MQNYLDMLNAVMKHGVTTGNRTGVHARKLFGWQLRFNLAEGFPLVTTKKVFLKGIIHELLWFIKGDTNNHGLVEKGVHIWDEWALKEAKVDRREIPYQMRVQMYARIKKLPENEAFNRFHVIALNGGYPEALAELERGGVPMYGEVERIAAGELGPIYGKQWRSWTTGKDSSGKDVVVDQLKTVLRQLKETPESRRIIVNAWNVADLPDESLSPQENVLLDKQALAPCHTMFQFGTMPMYLSERINYMLDRPDTYAVDSPIIRSYYEWMRGDADSLNMAFSEELDRYKVPKYRLNCQLYQRSGDLFLGVPYNIASYALLTMMVAQVSNMIPGDFVHTFGDLHIYDNHFDQVNLQLSRETRSLPTMTLNPNVTSLFDFTYDDFTLEGYEPHPPIKGEVAV